MSEEKFHLEGTDTEVREIADLRAAAEGELSAVTKSETATLSFIHSDEVDALVTPTWDKLIKLKAELDKFETTPLTFEYRQYRSLLEKVKSELDKFEKASTDPLLKYLAVESALLRTLVKLETNMAASINQLVADVEELTNTLVIDTSRYPKALEAIDLTVPQAQVHKSLKKLFVPIEYEPQAA